MKTYKVTADPMLRPVSAYTAPGELYAEGVCVGVCDVPTLVIETSTGQKVHWRADLCKVDGEEMTERQLQAFRDKQPKVVTIDPDDREQVERLCDLWFNDGEGAGVSSVSDMQAALREFAKPATVMTHFVVNDTAAGTIKSLCGKVWNPNPAAKSEGRCPDCEELVDGRWRK